MTAAEPASQDASTQDHGARELPSHALTSHGLTSHELAAHELAAHYRAYLDCLNRQDWPALDHFVAADARHNDRPLGLAGYRAMLEQDYRDIPDLHFEIELLVADPPRIAARLRFDCHPAGDFLRLAVNGRHVTFAENVFYEFRDGRIAEVWSVLDKAAIERQLAGG